jgi:thiamine kinase-like enzyme
MSHVDEIIRKIWENTVATYEPLDGGFVNFTYKVRVGGGCFALRIHGGQNDHLGLSRQDEMTVMRLAGDMGIAPKVMPQSTAEYFITEFIDAPAVTREDIHRPSMVQKAMDVLRKIHGIQGVGRCFSPFDLVNKHIEGMKALNVPFPKELDQLLPESEAIRKRFDEGASYRKAYCHNDYYRFNILNAESGLYVLDWELSGMGDIFFDLATISFHDAFTDEQDEHMLRCYFGQAEPEHVTALRDMKYMNMLREATWGLLHSGMNESTVNHSLSYLEHGKNTLKRLKEGFLYL